MNLLIAFHSLMRWLVLISLVYSIYRAYSGWIKNGVFGKWDNKLRHYTATIAHIQLVIGYVVYFKSAIVSFFLANFKTSLANTEMLFFGLLHVLLMTIAIIFITIGSAMAKRKETDRLKFKTMGLWFLVALIIIFIAIPWPFSPLANRPYLRPL